MKVICFILLSLQIFTTNLWLSEKKKAHAAEAWADAVMYQAEECLNQMASTR